MARFKLNDNQLRPRRPEPSHLLTTSGSGLTYHSDRGMQYVPIRYANRLAEARSDMLVGSIGDGYDNALAETVIGLFETEVVKHLGPWKTNGQFEWETMKWVHWYNKDRTALGFSESKRLNI